MRTQLIVGILSLLLTSDVWAIQGVRNDTHSNAKSQSIHALANLGERSAFVPEMERAPIKPGIARMVESVPSPMAAIDVPGRANLADRTIISRPQATMQRADLRKAAGTGGHHGNSDNSRASPQHCGGVDGRWSGRGFGSIANSNYFAGYPYFGSPFGFGDAYFFNNGFGTYPGFGPGFFGGDFYPVGFLPTRSVTIMYADPEGRRWDMMMRGIYNFAAGKTR